VASPQIRRLPLARQQGGRLRPCDGSNRNRRRPRHRRGMHSIRRPCVLIAAAGEALHFGRILRCLQVVGNGNHRQQNRAQHRQRNQLHTPARQQSSPARRPSRKQPESPECGRYRDPRKIGKEFHALGALYPTVSCPQFAGPSPRSHQTASSSSAQQPLTLNGSRSTAKRRTTKNCQEFVEKTIVMIQQNKSLSRQNRGTNLAGFMARLGILTIGG